MASNNRLADAEAIFLSDSSEKRSEQRNLGRWSLIMAIVFGPLAFFYLFILPMMTALQPREYGIFGVGFATFLFGQLSFIVFDSAISVAAAFYGFSWVNPLDRKMRLSKLARRSSRNVSRGRLVVLMFVSFVACNYAFAVLYVFISNLDPTAFSVGRLNAIDGIYFSTVTAATVGYGDIAPISTAARLIVVLQILMSLAYVVLLFSACSSFLAQRNQQPTDQKKSDFDS